MIDTGSTFTRLSEGDWKQKLGISPKQLGELKDAPPILTVTGSVSQWIIPPRTQLIFRGTRDELYFEEMRNMRVIKYPPELPDDQRRRLSALPSILGRDLILKFRMTLTHEKVVFERPERRVRG